MSLDVYNEQIPKLYTNLYEMSANIDFIQRELPRCHAPEVVARNISSVCHEFEGALHDVRKEVRTLEDKLGLHPGEEPFDPGVTNSDPRVTMTFIREWLLAEIERLHETVTQLQGDPSANAIHGSLYILVSESGKKKGARNQIHSLERFSAPLVSKPFGIFSTQIIDNHRTIEQCGSSAVDLVAAAPDFLQPFLRNR